jgi:hypothetical protein
MRIGKYNNPMFRAARVLQKRFSYVSDLAIALKRNTHTVRSWVQGKRKPDFETLNNMVELLTAHCKEANASLAEIQTLYEKQKRGNRIPHRRKNTDSNVKLDDDHTIL